MATEININSKVSIILPTYNRAGLIMETIESIWQQTHSNWELIIVDDGSTDNTEELIQQLRDSRIKFIKAGRIGIGGKIKNIGLQHVTGEFIAFIDSDDLWAAAKLKKQVDALSRYPEAGFCLTNGYVFEDINQPQKYFYKQLEGEKCADIFISFFKSEIAGYAQALMLRRDCLSVTGNFKEVKSFSDIDYIASLASQFKAVMLYEPLVYRRLHDANFISENWEQSYYDGIDLIRTNRSRLPKAVFRNALFKLYINFGEKCLVYKQPRKAAVQFFQSWKYRLFSIIPLKKIAKATWYFLRKK